jgi:hypothetical protein
LIVAARAVGMPSVARDAQRSVVLRIGRGGPALPDGFNPDLELLARVTMFANLFDNDFRLLLGFFVLNNFTLLLQYHETRARVHHLAIDRGTMVRALCVVLPGECKKEVRPSRWLHWKVQPFPQKEEGERFVF